uniref:Uncharacterized protein n=1 Tax=Nelumbo nucifera TaxID=4432 RepID=A0A822Y078_NELNU|nr:TPA_asm: hypothetical protein HUJ06_025919 [Nelumbo nucifera]
MGEYTGAIHTDVPGGSDVLTTMGLRHDSHNGDIRSGADGLVLLAGEQRLAFRFRHRCYHLDEFGESVADQPPSTRPKHLPWFNNFDRRHGYTSERRWGTLCNSTVTMYGQLELSKWPNGRLENGSAQNLQYQGLWKSTTGSCILRSRKMNSILSE